MNTTQKHPRHLASPHEVMAVLSESVSDSSSMVCQATIWEEVQLVEMTFPDQGCVVVPPIAFYSVSSNSGTRSYLCEDSGTSATPVLIPPGATPVHEKGAGARYAWTAPHHAYMTCLDPAVIACAAEECDWLAPPALRIPSSFDRRDEVLERGIAELVAEARVGPHALRRLAVQSIVDALAQRLLERGAPAGSRGRRPGALSACAFERVRSYVEDNLGGNVSLAALAEVAGVSRFHFARQFRLRTGESPLGYVRRQRIERAKELLRRSGLRIAAVALALGFADQSHFTRAFQSSVGMTPARYARRQGRTGS